MDKEIRWDKMNEKPIVIADKYIGIYLIAIGERGTDCDEMVLHVINKYKGKAERLIRILNDSFGWNEKERKMIDLKKIKCKYNKFTEVNKFGNTFFVQKCTHPKRGNEHCRDESNECSYFKPALTQNLQIWEITIERSIRM